jgi:hypothetical protein
MFAIYSAIIQCMSGSAREQAPQQSSSSMNPQTTLLFDYNIPRFAS